MQKALPLADQIERGVVLLLRGKQLVSLFGAEVRHVDHRRRIIGQYLQLRPACQPHQPLARLEHGQGAKQPTGIEEGGIIVHGDADKPFAARFEAVFRQPQRVRCFVHGFVTSQRVTLVSEYPKAAGMFGIEIIDAALLPAMLVALTAGVLSFLSPCVLPIVPPYLAYMSGVSVSDLNEGRNRAILPALFFVLGLSTVFLLLGFAASVVGTMFLQYQDWFNTIAGVLVMIFGAHFIGIYRIGFLDRDTRMDAGDQGGSALGAYILGLAFAFGWTPCIGPQLGAILSLAASEASISRGTALLAVYAAGLGIPFLLVAAFLPRLTGLMGWMKRHMEQIERVMGLLLWTIGLLMLTGGFSTFSYWLLEQFPALATLG